MPKKVWLKILSKKRKALEQKANVISNITNDLKIFSFF